MRRLLSLFFVACLPTTDFVRTVPSDDGQRHPRPARDVEVFFGTPPARTNEKVGYFDRTPSDFVDDKSVDLVEDLRRKAGYHGCDGVLIPSKDELDRLAKSSTEKARAYCLMYR